MNINDIKYGNPTVELHNKATRPNDPIRTWFINQGIANYIIKGAPANDSEVTQNDIRIMMSKMESITAEDLIFARDCEESWEQIFIDFFTAKGIEEGMGELHRIDDQTEPLLFFLKNAINRPRPYQLAYAMDIPLYPIIHTDACSAAYPSGHALSAYVISEYYSRKYPQYRPELILLGERIANSRVQMGIHFPSDSKISKKICEMIWKNDLISC
jgi:acid phosphatase (class A)